MSVQNNATRIAIRIIFFEFFLRFPRFPFLLRGFDIYWSKRTAKERNLMGGGASILSESVHRHLTTQFDAVRDPSRNFVVSKWVQREREREREGLHLS